MTDDKNIDEVVALLREANSAWRESERMKREANALRSAAVVAATGAGLTRAQTAQWLETSPQRVQQILDAARSES